MNREPDRDPSHTACAFIFRWNDHFFCRPSIGHLQSAVKTNDQVLVMGCINFFSDVTTNAEPPKVSD
jgi:hypothetical protein